MSNFSFDHTLKLMELKANDKLTETSVHKAYLKAARKLHPDKNSNKKITDENFKDIGTTKDLLVKICKAKSSSNYLIDQEHKKIAIALATSSYSTRINLLKLIAKEHEHDAFLIRGFVEDYQDQNPKVIQKDAGGYTYATFYRGRDHGKYTVTAQGMRPELCSLKGDVLKTAILTDFKASLEDINNPTQLQQKIEEFKASDEYKTLAKGQGWSTQTFGLKTSSVKVFDNIVAEKETELNNQSSTKNTI